MGQANKRGTFSQRLAIAQRKAAVDAIERKATQQKIIDADEVREYIAKQRIMSHWEHPDISHRAAFSSYQPIVAS